MKKLYFLAAFSAAILSLSSCSDKSDDPNAAHGNRIDFTTYVNATRGVTSDLSTLQQDGFTLWAAQNTGAAYNAATDKVGFLYEEPVRYEAGQHYWAYDNIKFWPENGAISFFAVAPASQFGAALQSTHSKGDAGAPVVTYQMPVAQDNQVDIIAAQNLDRAADGNKVVFNFKHMLSKLDFSVRMPELDGVAIHLRKVELYYKNNAVSSKCAIDLNDMTSTVASDDVPFTSGAADDVLAASLYDGDKVVTTTATRIAETADKFLLVVPQTYALGDLYAKVSYTINVTDPALASTTFENVVDDKVINLPVVAGGWLQGKSYKYAMNLGTDHITFDTHVDVLPWDSEEEIPVNPDTTPDWADGISYDSATHIYHVTTAEGMAVLDDVWDGTNTIPFEGCETNFQQCVDILLGDNVNEISLDADIDMSSINDWKPMSIYNDFKGNGHTLSNLTITADSAALFKWVGKLRRNITVSDLTVKNFTVTGTQQAASITANIHYSVLKHCFAIDDSYKTGHIAIRSGDRAGGLVAHSLGGTIYYCGVETNVQSDTGKAGSFISDMKSTNMVACYSKAQSVTNTNNDFVFYNECDNNYDAITSCIQIYGATPEDYTWEQFNNTRTLIYNTNWLFDAIGNNVFSYGGYDYTTSVKDHTPYINVGIDRYVLTTPEYYFSMTSDDVELIPAADISAPFSQGLWYEASTKTYHVETPSGLSIMNAVCAGTNTIAFDGCPENFQQRVNADEDTISLDADLDMSAVTDWKPLDLSYGYFDGNNHTISNLTITADEAAFFKKIGNTTYLHDNIGCKNLKLKNCTSIGTTKAALFAIEVAETGIVNCQCIDDSYTTGHVAVQSGDQAAGFACLSNVGLFFHCGVACNVHSDTNSAGSFACHHTGTTVHFIGCYSRSRNITNDGRFVFTYNSPDDYSGSEYVYFAGCGVLHGATAADYPWTYYYNFPPVILKGQYCWFLTGCYGGYDDYATSIKPNIAAINQAVTDWMTPGSAYIFYNDNLKYSETSDDFELVPNE